MNRFLFIPLCSTEPEQYVQENVKFFPVSFPVTYIVCEMNASVDLNLQFSKIS